MEKFEGKLKIKKPEATQLDLNFEDTSKKLDVEKEFIIGKDNSSGTEHADNDDKEDPSNEYYKRFNKNMKEKILPPSKRKKTQQEKDFEKKVAILKALEKRKNKGYTTGYEHPDPWDMSR